MSGPVIRAIKQSEDKTDISGFHQMFCCMGGFDIRQRKIMDHLLGADSFSHRIRLKWQHGAQDFGLSEKLDGANIIIITYGA